MGVAFKCWLFWLPLRHYSVVRRPTSWLPDYMIVLTAQPTHTSSQLTYPVHHLAYAYVWTKRHFSSTYVGLIFECVTSALLDIITSSTYCTSPSLIVLYSLTLLFLTYRARNSSPSLLFTCLPHVLQRALPAFVQNPLPFSSLLKPTVS